MTISLVDGLWVQLIGFVAVIVGFAVFQINQRNRMLLLNTVAALLWVVHFFLLGAMTGSAMNFVTAIRNLAYYKAGKNRSVYIPLGFALIFISAAIFTWQGPYSLLPMTGSLIGTLAFWQVKTHFIRLIAIVGPSLWMIYNVHSGSYAGITSDILVLSSIALGIYRFDIKPRLRFKVRKAHFLKKLKSL